MAATAAAVVFFPERSTHREMISSASLRSFFHPPKSLSDHMPSATIRHLRRQLPFPKVTPLAMAAPLLGSPLPTAESGIFHLGENKEGLFLETQVQQQPQLSPLKALFLWAFVWVSALFFFLVLACGGAAAAVVADSIRASSFGLKVAAALRGSGWPDDGIVFTLATLPVLELRGAIPVGYWMRLDPLRLTILSVLGFEEFHCIHCAILQTLKASVLWAVGLGLLLDSILWIAGFVVNMVPVPFILLYLKKFATFIAGRNASMSHFMDLLFERAKEKAGPVEEFQWLGLMLFVAVPFPGTGAWTGAIVASILDMPFWSAVSANFFGVVFAGLLVNMLVNLGLKYAVATGFILFIISTVMWSVLRFAKSSMGSN